MSITIKEIAELANTSRGTVDRVLNKRGRVSKEQENKILKIAVENKYKPNTSAKALVNSKKKYLIGVVINSVGNEFFNNVLNGIKVASEEIENKGISVIVKQIKGYSVVEQINAINELMAQNINALALTPINDPMVVEKIDLLKQDGVLTVLFNSDLEISQRLAFVGCDNAQSGRLAAGVAELVLPPKSTIAIVTGSLSNTGHCKRIDGFKKVLNESEKQLEIVEILEGLDDNDNTYSLTQNLMKKYPSLNLIYFGAAGIEGGMKAIAEVNAKVKAITVDQTEIINENMANGTIFATITQQPFQQGYKTILLLTDYLIFGYKPQKSKIYTYNEIKIKYSK